MNKSLLHASHLTMALTAASLLIGALGNNAYADEGGVPVVKRKLVRTTQGPLWPPSTVTDQNGNFVVIGQVLTEIKPGNIAPVRGMALVSKDTVPPLDAQGKEDFSNFFGAPHKVLRPLDLTPGSEDLRIVLYTPSYGPTKGNFGGGGRIPMDGESRYNLNAIPLPCPELFPTSSQAYTYKRQSFPLHQYPILGFQGDQVAYDIETGNTYDPKAKSGTGCGAGCSGENSIDSRLAEPITLGRWLEAKGEMKIALTRYDARVSAYTAARFDFKFHNLLPKSLYTLWAVRENVFSQGRMPGPFALPSAMITDENGNAEFSTELQNPFPDRLQDEGGVRLIGVEISYHPDYQNWGACPEKWGVGYRVLNWFDFLPDGTRDLSQFITRAAR
jgi:hypothetical protein